MHLSSKHSCDRTHVFVTAEDIKFRLARLTRIDWLNWRTNKVLFLNVAYTLFSFFLASLSFQIPCLFLLVVTNNTQEGLSGNWEYLAPPNSFLMITALFWVIARRVVVISYRHFGTTSLPQYGYKITTTGCVLVTAQQSAVFIYSEAETLFPAVKVYS
jgi:hypothetical protein